MIEFIIGLIVGAVAASILWALLFIPILDELRADRDKLLINLRHK